MSERERKLLVAVAVVVAVYFLYVHFIPSPVYNPDDQTQDGATDSDALSDAVSGVASLIGSTPQYLNAWADAITIHEGWRDGSVSFRNNNPGNLEIQGDNGRDDRGFGIFSTYAAGRAALLSDLTAKVRKYGTWTLFQVMSRYAPPSENDTAAYTAAVAAALRVSASTPVNTISGVWQQQNFAWSPVSFPTADATADSTLVASSDGSDSGITDGTYSTDGGYDA